MLPELSLLEKKEEGGGERGWVNKLSREETKGGEKLKRLCDKVLGVCKRKVDLTHPCG